MDDDDGFVGYVPTTVDVDGGLLAAAIFACIFSYLKIMPLSQKSTPQWGQIMCNI